MKIIFIFVQKFAKWVCNFTIYEDTDYEDTDYFIVRQILFLPANLKLVRVQVEEIAFD